MKLQRYLGERGTRPESFFSISANTKLLVPTNIFIFREFFKVYLKLFIKHQSRILEE